MPNNGTKFTPEEDAIIRRIHGKMRVAEIGEILGRSKSSIKGRLRRLCLREPVQPKAVKPRAIRSPRIKEWTAEQTAFITANYLSMTDAEMGRHLGRSTSSVVSARNRLRLTVRYGKDGASSGFRPKRPRPEAIKWALANFNHPNPDTKMEARLIAGQLV